LSKVDIVLSLLLILGAYLGYKRGFLAELFFVAALILGVLVGFKLMGWGMEYLHKEFKADTAFLPYLSFFIIFILVVIGVVFIGNRIKHLMDDTFLGRIDSIAGAMIPRCLRVACFSGARFAQAYLKAGAQGFRPSSPRSGAPDRPSVGERLLAELVSVWLVASRRCDCNCLLVPGGHLAASRALPDADACPRTWPPRMAD